MNLELIQSFENHPIRILGTTDKPLFVASDACKAWGIANNRDAALVLDPDQTASVAITDTSSSSRKSITVLCVTESGLYELAFKSRKPAAKRFRRWITDEVLPSIRKTGTYTAPTQPPARPKLVPARPSPNPVIPHLTDLHASICMMKLMADGMDPGDAARLVCGQPHRHKPAHILAPPSPPPLSPIAAADAAFFHVLTPGQEYRFSELALICRDHGLFSHIIQGEVFFGEWRLSFKSTSRFGLLLRAISARHPTFITECKGRHRRFRLSDPIIS